VTKTIIWLSTIAFSTPSAARKWDSNWVRRVGYWLWFDGRGLSWSRSAAGLWTGSWKSWKNGDFRTIPELLGSARWLGAADLIDVEARVSKLPRLISNIMCIATYSCGYTVQVPKFAPFQSSVITVPCPTCSWK
jgi:hypothetical protein